MKNRTSITEDRGRRLVRPTDHHGAKMKRESNGHLGDRFQRVLVGLVLFCFVSALAFDAQKSIAQTVRNESKTALQDPFVAERELRVESTSANPGGQVTVNIRIDAAGDEAEYGFRVNYNQAILSSPVVGAGNAGAAVISCDTATAGQVNCSVGGFPNNNPGSSSAGIGEIASGNNQILITITFNVSAGAPSGLTPLTLSNVNTSNDAAVLLAITATNGNVTINSPAAPRQLRVESTNGTAGQPVTVNIRVDAVGDESGYGFVVLYNPTILSNPVIGAGSPGGALVRDCNTATAGVVNCSVDTFPNNNPTSSSSGIGEIPSGNNQILITITFNIAASALSGVTPVTFRQTGVNSPPNTSNDAAQSLILTSVDGTVSIAAARQLRVESTTAGPGMQAVVNIRADAMGDESEYGFVVNYDPAIISSPVISASGDPNGAALRDCNTATAGTINCSVGAFPTNNPASGNAGIGEIPAGNNQILIKITFSVAANAPVGTVTPVTFRQTGSNSPPNVSNDAAQLLVIDSMNGTVTIFSPTSISVSVGGRVTTGDGRGLAKATVAITDGIGRTQVTLTNPFGYFNFTGVEVGQIYVVSVSRKGYSFEPLVITVNEEISDLSISASP